ncbi:MAG: family 20 glycosylhydrolase [Myxococcales bacterium]|nr:family 20 glycosylhydrolase [Myxococcales bacterium]
MPPRLAPRSTPLRALASALCALLLGCPRPPAPSEPSAPTPALSPSADAPEPACAVVPAPRECRVHPGTVTLAGAPEVRLVPGWASERYELDTREPRPRIRAGARAGVFRAETTLAQLAPAGVAPRRVIEDEPAFPWRGLLVDVARHFFTVTELEQLVDRMALLKLDVLHLHLSDDQGFRLELDGHPELARRGAFRLEAGRSVGGSYSKGELAALVAYAEARFVEIVPEIDLPGHTGAILASHPELSCTGGPFEVPSTWGIFDDVLCAGNPATLGLVGEVLGEVAGRFPSPYLHVGGDEVPATRWSACPKCREAMRAAGLRSPSELQGVFTAQVTERVRARGKIPVAWDEVLEAGAPAGTVVMVWRAGDAAERALRAGHDVVLVPNDHAYLDAKQSGRADEPGSDRVVSWADVAAFAPEAARRAEGARGRVLGGQAALWTEHVGSLADADTLLFPRLLAVAEALWSAPRPPREDLEHRTRALLPLLDARHVGYFVAPPELPERRVFLESTTLEIPRAPLYGGRVDVALDDGAFTPFAAPLVLSASTRVRAVRVLPSGRRSGVAEGRVVREPLGPARPRPLGGPGVLYDYVEGEFARVPVLRQRDPNVSGSLRTFSLPPARRREHYALRERAIFVAPADGVYTFTVTSDDGAVLRVDDRIIVDNDGHHAPRPRAGEVALAKGAHDVELGFFQGGGGDALAVAVRSPDGAIRDLGELCFLPR